MRTIDSRFGKPNGIFYESLFNGIVANYPGGGVICK
jgi:hypothetical protein